MHSPTSQLSFATTEVEEAFDDEDSEEEAWEEFEAEAHSRPEVEWGQPDHVSAWNADHIKLDIYNLLF